MRTLKGKSYKSVAVRLDLDGKLNRILSALSEGVNVGKKNIIEAIFNISIGNDEFFPRLILTKTGNLK